MNSSMVHALGDMFNTRPSAALRECFHHYASSRESYLNISAGLEKFLGVKLVETREQHAAAAMRAAHYV